MSNFVMDQLKFVRLQTIEYVKGMDDSTTEIIPIGLKNHIKWNLGHMYVIHEKFAFQLAGQDTQYPANFNKLFDPGTKPSDWDIEPPTLSRLLDLLTEQMQRVEEVLSSKLNEDIHSPYKSSTGLTFTTVEQLLGFLIYHEAMHFATIKNMKSIIEN
ncbi:DinB family protein [Saccharibacillus endophyticus]|uniref:DinB-like domain-containing protein n=1 Tax=Saccharibacillus endophyticus TaxID=2060666 RepID=A0ABQ1ZK99_9BACL|nr:DinB family protein [Saccharibacillus endophyticus]GGH69628.1 hypothetical protein GCM10007362_04910 [Saccharibacillus endophyticus]